MEHLFEEILSIEGIMGAIVLSDDGSNEFAKFIPPLIEKVGNKNFSSFLKNSINIDILKKAFDNVNEALLIYDRIRLYVRKIQNGFLIIPMGLFVPVAMVRLNCQIIIPEIEKQKKSKGFGRFFKL